MVFFIILLHILICLKLLLFFSKSTVDFLTSVFHKERMEIFCSTKSYCSSAGWNVFNKQFCLFLCLLAFFSQKILPGGNTSFDVVFLARVVGNVENTLFINTSNHGVFTYQVRELHSFRKVVKCESTRAVSIMACLTIQGYLHNSGGVFLSAQLKKFPFLLLVVTQRYTIVNICRPVL